MLAVNGGSPLRRFEDWPPWPVCGATTRARLLEVLESGRWTISGFWRGRSCFERQFAERFAAFNGVPYCVPTTNGTSSLMIALEALDIGAGDEVIVPGLTWVAPAVAVVNVNAVPILVDIDTDSYCLDPHLVQSALTSRTRAILAVHLYCSMADLDSLSAIADAAGLPLIEDCAQSHGSRWRGRAAGTVGAIGVFSLHHGKPLTSGEGGAAITRDERLYARMEQLRADGRRYTTVDPAWGHLELDEVGEVMGSNACMSEFHAALALDGLERLDAENRHREANARYLDELLAMIPGVVLPKRHPAVDRRTYYHYLVRLIADEFAGRPAAAVGRALEAELGFWVHSIYAPLTRHPLYQPQRKRRYRWSPEHWRALDPARFSLPVAEAAHAQSLVFHHSVLLGTREDMEAIADAFRKVQCEANQIPS